MESVVSIVQVLNAAKGLSDMVWAPRYDGVWTHFIRRDGRLRALASHWTSHPSRFRHLRSKDIILADDYGVSPGQLPNRSVVSLLEWGVAPIRRYRKVADHLDTAWIRKVHVV